MNLRCTTFLRFAIWLIGIICIVPLAQAETDCNAGVSLMPAEQCETLLILYDSTDGHNWQHKEGWNTSDEPRDFVLVDTDNDGNVVELNLSKNRLTGKLPDLSSLTSLEKLNLFRNKLSGTLPSLTTFIKLKKMDLMNNELTGPIPDLSYLAQVEEIILFDNQLCGQIPDLSSLTKIKRLDLSQNQLSGPIPDLSKLTNLRNLGLSGNQLCQEPNNDYTGFEHAVASYPLCTENDQYPSCDTKPILTVLKDGDGSITGENIECGDDCSEEYIDGTVVTLTAVPANNTSFTGWTGACSGMETSCQITMSSSQSVTASFVLAATFTLTVNQEGNGIGIITAGGIECGNDCSEQYTENSEVTLTATPATGSIFAGWAGACSDATTTCQITLTQAQNVTATFNQASNFGLTVENGGTGVGTVSGDGINCGATCNAQYIEYTEITLTAIPAVGSVFAGWSGACVDVTPSCQVSMNQAKNVTATFNQSQIPNFDLTIIRQGTGDGTVVTDDINEINCGSDCNELYTENVTITLTATPIAGSSFAGWSGACPELLVPVCYVDVSQARTVTATFNLVPATDLPELRFVGLKSFYNIGEWFMLDLVENLQTTDLDSRIDLWIAVEDPDNTFHYMAESLLEPFSFTPQPYRGNIISSELVDTEIKYHLLSLDVYPGIEGSYTFYAFYSPIETDFSEMLFRQLSNVAKATTFFSNKINTSPLPISATPLTMVIEEEVELMVDTNVAFNALLSTCTVAPIGIVRSIAGLSSEGSSFSCYVKALQQGEATLTTSDENGNTLQTPITVW